MENIINIWQLVDVLLKLILAVLCGGLVGLITDANKNSIGFSTLILACFTSALIIIVLLKFNISAHSNFNVEELGIVAVLISFSILGASIIKTQKADMASIISAVTILAVAAIGIAIGAGMYIEAVASGIVLSILLNFFRRLLINNSD